MAERQTGRGRHQSRNPRRILMDATVATLDDCSVLRIAPAGADSATADGIITGIAVTAASGRSGAAGTPRTRRTRVNASANGRGLAPDTAAATDPRIRCRA
jgi:hypothetical protein